MAFVIENGDMKKALQNSIEESLKDRADNACATWDINAVLAVAWGVKEQIEVADADEVQKFMEETAGSVVELGNGEKVDFIKGGVKVKGDKALLIYRYQLKK